MHQWIVERSLNNYIYSYLQRMKLSSGKSSCSTRAHSNFWQSELWSWSLNVTMDENVRYPVQDMSKMLQDLGNHLLSLWEWVRESKRVLQRRGHLNWKTKEMCFWRAGPVCVKGWRSERDTGGTVKNVVCVDYKEGLVSMRLDDNVVDWCQTSKDPRDHAKMFGFILRTKASIFTTCLGW